MGVPLTGMYLTGVYVMGVPLTVMYIMRVYFMKRAWHARASLIGVPFTDTYLIGVHVIGVPLMGVHIIGDQSPSSLILAPLWKEQKGV